MVNATQIKFTKNSLIQYIGDRYSHISYNALRGDGIKDSKQNRFLAQNGKSGDTRIIQTQFSQLHSDSLSVMIWYFNDFCSIKNK